MLKYWRSMRRSRRWITLAAVAAAVLLLLNWAAREAEFHAGPNAELFIAVESYCRCFGRMPSSSADLQSTGYLRPTGPADNGLRLHISKDPSVPPSATVNVAVSNRVIRDMSDIAFAWGVTPSDLALRNGCLYYRANGKEAILVTYGKFWASDWDRVQTRKLYEAMLAARSTPAQSLPTDAREK